MSEERTSSADEAIDSMADHRLIELVTRGAQKVINLVCILYALSPLEMPISTRSMSAFGIPLVTSLIADQIVDSSREVLINDLE